MFTALERYPEMICRKRLDVLDGDLRPVADAADARAYWAICGQAYPSLGFPLACSTKLSRRRNFSRAIVSRPA